MYIKELIKFFIFYDNFNGYYSVIEFYYKGKFLLFLVYRF